MKFNPPEQEDEETMKLRELGVPVEGKSPEEMYENMYEMIFSPMNLILRNVSGFKPSFKDTLEETGFECTDVFMGHKYLTFKIKCEDFEKMMNEFEENYGRK